MGQSQCHSIKLGKFPDRLGDKKMENEKQYIYELFNKEILKLRKEIYDKYAPRLNECYEDIDVKTAYEFFIALPCMETFNRPSWESLCECCSIAQENREENLK